MEIFLTYCVNSKVASVAEQSRASRVRAVGGDAWREYVSQNNVGTSRPRVKPLGFLEATLALAITGEMTWSNFCFNRIPQAAIWRITRKVLK